MDFRDLLTELESDPKNLKLFTGLLETVLTDGEPTDVTGFLEGFFAILGEDPGVETFLIQIGHKARTLKDPPRSDVLFSFLGRTYLDKLGNREKAETFLRNVAVTDDNRAWLTSFYVDFYAEKENWRRLEEFLSAHMSVPEGDNRDAAVKAYLAEIAELKGRPEKAVAFLQAAFAADDSNDAVANELKRLFREIGKWHALIDLLDKELARTDADDTDTRTAISIQIAEIYQQHVNSDTKAVAVYQSILEYDPTNRAIIETLAALYEKLQRWADLVQVLRLKHDATEDEDQRIEILMGIGTILVDKYAKAPEAVGVYEEVLAIRPDAREALGRIKAIYEARRDFEKLIEVQKREIALETDETARFEALVELARMANERVRKADLLIALWEEVLALDATNSESMATLEKLFERQKEWEKLASVLETQADLSETPADQLTILERLATVRSVRLKDDVGTVDAYQRILAVDRENRKAVGELKKIYVARSDWEGLEELYRNHGTMGDLLRILESRVNTTEERSEKVGLLFQVARLWMDEMDQAPRAVRTMESVLELDPTNKDAAARLIPIYREAGDWEKLIDVLRVTLGHADEAADQQALHIEIARTLEERLANPGDAFFHWADAFRLDWRHDEARASLYRLADQTGHHEELVLTLVDTLDGVDDADASLGFSRDIARLYDERLEEPDEALTYYGRVLDLAPEDADTLVRVEAIHRTRGAWEPLAAVLATRVPLTEDASERRALLVDLATVRDERLDDAEGAIAALKAILDDFPSDLGVLDRLMALLMKVEDWSALKDALETKLLLLQEAGAQEGPQVAELHKLLGMLAYGQGADPADVVDAYERALKADAGREDVVELLEELVAIGSLRRRIAEILEPVYLAAERWDRLADAYGLILRQTRKKEDRLELLFRRGEVLHQRLGRLEDAFACFSEYVDLNPANGEARELLYVLACELDRVEDLIDAFERKLKEATNPDVVVDLSYLLARAYTERVGDAETGSRYYRDVLELRPAHPRALDALEAIYQSAGRFEELIDIYRKKAELATDDDQRVGFHFRLARVTYEHLQQRDEAIAILDKVLAIRPDDLDAYRFLDRIHLEAQDWSALHETLERLIPLLAEQPDEQLDALKRLATLVEVQLEDDAEAVTVLRRVLDLQPGNDYAIGELERFFSEGKQVPAVLDILEPHYVDTDRWQPLITVLEHRIELADAVSDKIQLHERIADVYAAQAEDAEYVFLHTAEALRLDPDRVESLDRVDRVVEEQTGDAVALVDLLEEVSPRVQQVDVQRRVFRRIADTCADVFDDHERAIGFYLKALEVEPDAMDVVDRLVGLLRTHERWDDLIAVTARKADLVDDPDERRGLLLEVGLLTRDVVKRPHEAVSVYERVYEQFPDERGALDALRALYGELEDWTSLIPIYDEYLRLVDDASERVGYLYEKATLYEQFLSDADSAIVTYLEVLEANEVDLDALRRLDELYTGKADWPSVIDVLGRIQGLVDAAEASAVEYRVGQILFEQMEDAEGAVTRFERVLDDETLGEQAATTLADVFVSTEVKERVFAILEPWYKARQRWTDLVALHEHLASARDDLASKRHHLEAVASLQEEEIGDADAAFTARARCLALDPVSDEMLADITAFARRADRLEALVEALKEPIPSADPSTGYVLRQRVLTLLKDELGDFARAIAEGEAALVEFPLDPWFLAALDELYELTDEHEPLALILEQRIEITSDSAERMLLLHRKGTLAETHLGDLGLAFEAYRDALAIDPDEAKAVERLQAIFDAGQSRAEVSALLEPVYAGREDWDALLSLMIRKLEDVSEPDARFEGCLAISRLFEERKGDLGEAIRWLGEALVLRPYDLDLERRLDGFTLQAGAWANCAAIFLQAAEASTDDDARRVELMKKAARLYEDQLSAAEEALGIHERVHEIDPSDLESVVAMARILEHLERWADLGVVFETHAGLDVPDTDRVTVLLRLARLHVDRLGDLEAAEATFRRVLEIDDHERQALLALAEIYEVKEEHEQRYQTLEALYEIAEDDAQRVELLGTMARLLVSELDRREDAIRLLDEILILDPAELDTLHLLEELLEGSESWARLVEVFQMELRAEGLDDARQHALHTRIAHLALEQLDDAWQAQEAMEQALALQPSDHDAVLFLRRAYRENAQYLKLRDVLVGLLDEEGEASARGALYEELGEIYTDHLHDPGSAIATWNSLLEVDATNAAAIRSLERLYREEQRWADYTDVLERKLDLIDDEDDLKLTLMDMAGTRLDRLGDWEGAASTYERLLDLDPADEDATSLLERIYEDHGRFDDLTRLLERRLEIVEDTNDRIEIYERLGRIHDERRLDRGAALAAYRKAFDLDRSNAPVIDEIEKIASAAERWEDLYQVYRVLADEGDEDLRVEVLLKAARVAVDHLGNADDAVDLYERTLAIEPDNEAALRALQEIFTANELWQELAGVLKRLVDVALDPLEKLQFQNEVARLYEERIGDRETAVREYREALEIDELDATALGALERIFRDGGDPGDLIGVLEQRCSLEPEREAELRMEIGEIYERGLKDTAKAVEAYEEVLAYHPQHRQALERLEMLYAEKEDWRNLAEVFERLLMVADDPDERMRVCQNLAVLNETEFDAKGNAIDYYRKIQEIDPGNDDALKALDRLYRELEQWEDVVELLRDRIARVAATADDGIEDLYRDLAAIYLDKLQDLDGGIRALRTLLDLKPDDEAVSEKLQGIFEREEMWDDLVDLIDFLAGHTEDAADRIDLLYKKAELLGDKLYRSDDVVGVLDAIVEADASQTRALELLGEALRERGDLKAWLDRLKGALDRVDSNLPKAWIHTAIGVWTDRELGETDDAILHLERAFEYMPDYAEAIEPLAEIYVRREQWESAEPLLNFLLRRYEESQDLDKQCELFFRIGQTAEKLMDTERALVFYKKAIAIQPDFVLALLGLARLNYKKGYLEQAERYYNQVLEQDVDLGIDEQLKIYKALGDIALKQGNADKAGEYLQQVVAYNPESEEVLEDLATFFEMHEDWDNYIRYKRDLAHLKKDPLTRTELLLSIGDTYKDKLKRTDAAADAYREVLAVDPQARAPYLKLVELYVGSQQFEDAVQVLEDMNRDEPDADRRALNYMMAAELYRTKLGMPEEAIGFYNKALDEAPTKLEAFQAVDELLTKAREWKQLEENYLRMVKRIRGAEGMEKIEFMLYKNLGEIYRSRLKNMEYAVSAYQLAAKQNPTDVPVHEILADLYERLGKYEQAIEEHRGLIIAKPGRVESYRTLFRLFNDSKHYDKAWCMAGILNLLKKANEQEERFYRQSRAVTITSAKRPIEAIDIRENIFFQGENHMVGEVYQILYQIIGSRLQGRELRDFGLKNKHRVDINKDPHPIHDLLAAINRYLRIPLPEIYRSRTATGIRLADTNPPVLILGEDVYTGGRSSQELAYMLGKYMCYHHPMHMMAALYADPARLKVLYLAAEYVCFPDSYAGPKTEAVDAAAREISSNANPMKKRQLVQALEEARANEGGTMPSIDRWLVSIEYSAVNLGFTACNDIEVAAGLERDSALSMSPLTQQDKVRSLVLYAISRKYETITERLGIQIQNAI